MTTPTYRTLTEADTVQEGDEFQIISTGRWHPVAYSIGDRGDSNYRRLVEQTVEDPTTQAENGALSKMQADYESIAKAQREVIDSYVKRNLAEQLLCVSPGPGVENPESQARFRKLCDTTTLLMKANAINHTLAKRLEDALSDKVIAQTTLKDKEAVIRRLKEKLENVEPLFARLTAAEKLCETQHAILQQVQKALPVELQNSDEPFGDTVTDHIAALSEAQVSADYFFTLLTDIGSMFGLRASISEEGSICDHIIVEKIPELVAELIVKNETL